MITDLSTKTRDELIVICKDMKIKGYSRKNKNEIVQMIEKVTGKVIEKVTGKVTGKVTENIRMIDLFAGTGAFTWAFKQCNCETVFSNDIMSHSKTIYDLNFHGNNEDTNNGLLLQDLNDIEVDDIPNHDILTGGFPCQPFSIAGNQEGFHDTRSNVFWKILEIIDHHKPRVVILENVKNLVTHDNKRTLKTILENLSNRGYHITHKILNTAEITGIPQHRERIYIVCMKQKDVYDKFNMDFPSIPKKKISAYLESEIPEKYFYTNKSSTWDLLTENVTKSDTVYQYRRVYVRENKSSECPTLTANMGTGGHNVPIILDERKGNEGRQGIRKLTPRECFNLQGFPAEYKLPELADSNLYKLAGNAVSVPVVQLIANRLMKLM